MVNSMPYCKIEKKYHKRNNKPRCSGFFWFISDSLFLAGRILRGDGQMFLGSSPRACPSNTGILRLGAPAPLKAAAAEKMTQVSILCYEPTWG